MGFNGLKPWLAIGMAYLIVVCLLGLHQNSAILTNKDLSYTIETFRLNNTFQYKQHKRNLNGVRCSPSGRWLTPSNPDWMDG